MRKLKLKGIAALFAAAALAACGGGGGGELVSEAPPPAPSPGPSPAPGPVPGPAQSAPVNSVSNSSVAVSANSTLTFSSGNGNLISVDDVDGGLLSTSLIVPEGSLEMAGGSGATITGDRTSSVTVMGSIAQINAALDGMAYTAPSTAQTIVLQIMTQDASIPAPLSDTDGVTITVEALPAPPTPSAPVNTVSRDAVTVYTPATLTFNTGNGNSISVNDVDGGSLTTSLSVSAGMLTMAANSGAAITNNRTANVTVRGTIAQVNAALNGMVYTPPATAQTVDFQIVTQDATTPTPLSDTDQVAITVAVAEFQSNQDASVVWGQPNFITGSSTAPGQGNLLAPSGAVAVSDAGFVYVPDTGRDRLLVFGEAAGIGALATAVRGQPDFTTIIRAVAQGKHPTAAHVAIAGNRMAVAEPFASRVSLFDRPPTTPFVQPVAVLGQDAFTTFFEACAAAQLSGPRSVAITPDGNRLVVADTENNRVNIYNSFPLALGAPAMDIVLGQPDRGGSLACRPNRGGVVPEANSLLRPAGVWTDGARLVVADTGNNRVLIWTTFPAVGTNFEGSPPNLVLGQGDFNSNLPNRGLGTITSVGFNGPTHVASDGTRLAVADTGNNRVLIWTTFPTINSAAPQVVLGQLTMNSGLPNRGGAPQARTLSSPTGLHFHEGRLYVTDQANNRVLIYQPQ